MNNDTPTGLWYQDTRIWGKGILSDWKSGVLTPSWQLGCAPRPDPGGGVPSKDLREALPGRIEDIEEGGGVTRDGIQSRQYLMTFSEVSCKQTTDNEWPVNDIY